MRLENYKIYKTKGQADSDIARYADPVNYLFKPNRRTYMTDNLPLTKNISPEDYFKLKTVNSKLQKRVSEIESVVIKLENEISKLKSKRSHGGRVRID